jgi:hypothetical protein
MLVKVKRGWKIKSKETGEVYPKVYSSEEKAMKREKQMNFFKHAQFSKSGKLKGFKK